MSNSKEDRQQVVYDVGEEILKALQAVFLTAERALAHAPSGTTVNLATPSNMMVGDAKPERYQHAKNVEAREQLRRLLIEPFVARVEVQWESEGRRTLETIYFPRRSAAGLTSAVKGALFVTAGAALGALAEHEAGEIAVISVGDHERRGYVLKRVVLSPEQQEGIWDALVRQFEATPGGDLLTVLRHDSLRKALEGIRADRAGPLEIEDVLGRLAKDAADAEFERHRVRRKVVDRIALRDQPILNKFQGEIFRLPLNRQVLLFGPPGSGKTTTLIKRLAQKRTPDALTDVESRLVANLARDEVAALDSWAMFSPAELLKQYLGSAFNQEGVPDAGNVRTWDKERHDLARNVLNILRSNNSGRFQWSPAAGPLIVRSSRSIASLHDDFAAHVDTNLLKRCKDAMAGLRSTKDEAVGSQVLRLQAALRIGEKLEIDDILRLFEQAEGFQAEIKRLSDRITADVGNIFNFLMNTNKPLLEEVALALPSIRGEEEEEPEEDADEAAETVVASGNARHEAANILLGALRNWARAVAEGRRSLSGQSGRAIEFVKAKLPPDDRFAGIGADIATRAHLRTLVSAPRTLVLGVPGMYVRFRRQALRDGRHFQSDDASTLFLNRSLISSDEVDVLLLVMLRNARRIIQHAEGRRLQLTGQYDWLESIRGRYLTQVFVDEATDFSAVQLGCTIELSGPRLRSWFACGDLRQRITANGVQDDAEIAWLDKTTGVKIDLRRVDIGYRQSRRLRELSDALAGLLETGAGATRAPPGDEEADAWPLLGEGLSGDGLAQWLADRIHEVERGIGRLPSIAVFVDGDDLIDPLIDATRPLLEARNIPIVGCKEGRVVGDDQEVRVFDVQHIKGLEFEAVFFIGIDRLADRIPDLFQRFLYVGVTRAATYLGLTCERELPTQLEPLRPNFGAADWSDG